MKTTEEMVHDAIEQASKTIAEKKAVQEAKEKRTGKVIENVFKLLFGIFLICSFCVGITRCFHSFAQ